MTWPLPVEYDSIHPRYRRDVRAQYVHMQQGACFHCGESLHDDPPEQIQSTPVNLALFPKGFFDHPVHLHHSHETGMTLGAVHARCNAVLWQHHGE